jgi:transcriptional regulator with XRE-family HTH domain
VKGGEGFDLKVERLRLGLTQQEIADELGVNRSRVAAIEAERRATREAVERFRAALYAVAARDDAERGR